MGYRIRYALTCFQGLVRQNNEDNYCVSGMHLPEKNHGSAEIQTGILKSASHPILAAFDGMGGEAAGETAAYLAAAEMAREQKKRSSLLGGLRSRRGPAQLCADMNRRVCDYAAEKHIHSMGATLVYAEFNEDACTYVNIGDSRIYLWDGVSLRQVSEDHVAEVTGIYRKAPLIQYLGIPEHEMQLSPHIGSCSVKSGMKLLLCSDGLTDLVRINELETYIRQQEDPAAIVTRLQEEVMRRGAVDNTTIILAETEHV